MTEKHVYILREETETLTLLANGITITFNSLVYILREETETLTVWVKL